MTPTYLNFSVLHGYFLPMATLSYVVTMSAIDNLATATWFWNCN